jgi:ubiquinol-cytochrome c reductase cytochrome c subunit
MRRLRGRAGALAFLLLLGGVLGLAVAGSPARAEPPSQVGDVSSDASNAAPVAGADRGRQLYLYSCATCHGQQGQGSQRGPSLVGVGAATVDFYLRTGRMPLPWDSVEAQAGGGSPKFNPADIAGYVGSLGSGPPVPDVSPGDPVKGRDLYEQNCASCHAPSGVGYTQVGGRIAPSVLQDDPTAIAEAVRVGPNTMPQFGASVLDDSELDDVVAYVQQLQRPEVGGHGGAQIGRIGAAIEAPVAFAAVVLLCLLARLLGRRSPGKEQP